MSNCRQPCQRPAGPSIAIPASAGRERALLLQRWLHSNPRGRGIAAGPGVQAEGVGLRAVPGSPNRQSRTPEEKCNVARCPSPISRRSLVLKVTTCPYFVRFRVRCGEGTRNRAELLDSPLRGLDQARHLSSVRKRIESNARPQLTSFGPTPSSDFLLFDLFGVQERTIRPSGGEVVHACVHAAKAPADGGTRLHQMVERTVTVLSGHQ